jgi:hypothetical protein
MKTLFGILIVIETLLCVTLAAPCLVDDWTFAKAVADYAKTPTPTTQSVMKTEGTRIRRERMAVDCITAGLLLANTIALYRIRKQIRKREQPRPDPYAVNHAG